MDIFQTIILALIQGVTEFLPISSSAHLILLPKITDFPDQGLAFDVVVHFGTLFAIIFYYRASIIEIIYAFFHHNPNTNTNAKLGWGVIIATVPVAIIGFIFKDVIQYELRSILVIAYSTIFFGVVLGAAELVSRYNKSPKEYLSWGVITIIGLMQSFALIPGTSRSGVVFSTALLLGISRKLAIKFTFLLSIPVILFSLISILIDLYSHPQNVNLALLSIGFIISAISSYLVVVFFVKLIENINLLIFVIYRLFLGVFLLLL